MTFSCNVLGFRVEFPDNLSRVSQRHRVGGNIGSHHRPGANHAVFADGDTFANDGAVPDPDVFFQLDRPRLIGRDSIDDIVPIAVRREGVGTDQAVSANIDADARRNARAMGDNGVISYIDAAARLGRRPAGDARSFSLGGDDADIVSHVDVRTEDFYVPGIGKRCAPAAACKMTLQKMVSVKFVKTGHRSLDVIWSVFFIQLNSLLCACPCDATFSPCRASVLIFFQPAIGKHIGQEICFCQDMYRRSHI